MIKRYEVPLAINKEEVARYLGYKNSVPDTAVLNLIDECTNKLKYDLRVCYLPLKVAENDGETVDFGCFSVKSRDFSKFIGKNEETILFGATIGIDFDRLLKAETVLSQSRAVVLQAVGTTAIEELCDLFCSEFNTKARFSPGYGDLDISVQKQIFKVLDLEKSIGVTLTQSLLMTPTKSVTAFLIPNTKECTNCENCNIKESCTFRKV